MKSKGQPSRRRRIPTGGQRDPLSRQAGGSPALRRFFIQCYQELLLFLEERRDRMRGLAADDPKEQQKALELSEIEPMEKLIIQLQQRLWFWRNC